MALSNVQSSAYRAAGGKAWNKIKGGNRGIIHDGPVPEFVEQQRYRMADTNDRYMADKAKLRAELAQGYDESLVTVVPAGESGKKRKGKK